MASKKRKMSAAAASSSTRPIDKTIVNIVSGTITSTQTNRVLLTAVGPCTIKGLRWDLNYKNNSTASDYAMWAIYRLKEGYSVPTVSAADATTLCEPEQEVLVWGVFQGTDIDASTGPAIMKDKGQTQTMRKLMNGDRLYLSITAGSAANNVLVGAVQFFCAF